MPLSLFRVPAKGKGGKGKFVEFLGFGIQKLEKDDETGEIDYSISLEKLPSKSEIQTAIQEHSLNEIECMAHGINTVMRSLSTQGGMSRQVSNWLTRDGLKFSSDTQRRAIIGNIVNAVAAELDDLKGSYASTVASLKAKQAKDAKAKQDAKGTVLIQK